MRKSHVAVVAAALALGAPIASAAEKHDKQMMDLARKAGCMTCHSLEQGAKLPDGGLPVGPAWKDVAVKYKGDKTAHKRITTEVLTGTSPYENHWKGKVTGIAMPPNAVVIKEKDADRLVGWILSLAK